MARPLRMQIAGGRYHVTARGNEQRNIFRQDRDRLHFLELLAQWPARFGVRLHAYVLMDNHYHLVLETPEPNLSLALHWLNVSYTTWYNRKHQRCGHLLQGRFHAVLLQDQHHLQTVARYVHLNPVRRLRFGLDKGRRHALAAGLAPAASDELLRARLDCLRQYPWSSYLALAGYRAPPAWLTLQPLRGLSGGRSAAQQLRAFRRYTEDALKERELVSPWEDLRAGLILGAETFAREMLHKLKANPREQPQLARAAQAPDWPQIVQALERAKGEAWNLFCARHGDWGRDAALWLGRHAGRLRLATVGKAVSRFGARLKSQPALAKTIAELKL